MAVIKDLQIVVIRGLQMAVIRVFQVAMTRVMMADGRGPALTGSCNWLCRQSSCDQKTKVTAAGFVYKFHKYTVKKGSRVSRPQPGCHYQTLPGRE